MRIQLPNHSYEHYSKPVGVERLVNCMAERAPPEGKAPAALLRTPGILPQTNVGTGQGRGLFKFKGQLYAVSGNTLYLVTSSNTVTAIGSVPGTDIVSFALTPTQLVVCSASGTVVYDGAALAAITDPDFDNGVQCCAVDSYVLFRKGNSGKFFSSDFADATSYDALNFATAEGAPDNIVGIITDHRQVVLLGEDTGELWGDSGASGFPFERDPNGFFELGCAAGSSLAKFDNSIVWLASDLTVRRLNGLTPERISQHGVEQAIGSYTRVDDAYAFTYKQLGHEFYVLVFPTDEHTWIYDANTTEWHERESYGEGRWRPCSACYCYGKWYVQDFETGKVGTLDINTYTEWGDTLRSSMTFPSVYNNGDYIAHNSFEIMVETGVGTETGQGFNPQLTLEISDDDGRTYRTLPTKSIGKTGEFKKKVIWDALGASYARVYRFSFSDPCKLVVSDAAVNLG